MASLIAHFRMLAEYNRWANRRVYEAVGMLSEAEFASDRGAIFGSLRGTLNHLLVTDRLWLARVTGEAADAVPLDAIVHGDLAALADARRSEDERIVAFITGLDEESLADSVRYTLLKTPDDVIVQPLGESLAHWFNHQTHHRGEVIALLTIAGGRAVSPNLDLILFQRSEEHRPGTAEQAPMPTRRG